MTTPTLLQRTALALATPVLALGAWAGIHTGPSSSQSHYLVPLVPGVDIVSILTTGDTVNLKPDGATPYRMVGIPDGLGAFADEDDDTFTLLMNHELTAGSGIARAHGKVGAFVSRWVINRRTLAVEHGEDLDKTVYTWSGSAYTPGGGPMGRFCSADLARKSAWYDKRTRRGYNGLIFMNGEETGTEGRAFAHLLNGTSYELPYLGKLAWENAVANPSTGVKTVVVGTDDGQGGQVHIYVGDKKASSNPIEAAGLVGGSVYAVAVQGVAAEDALTGIPSGSAFTCVNIGDVSAKTGVQLDSAVVAAGGTSFLRPEDGCWDPEHPNDFYFVTTASFTGFSRLWVLHFKDAANPALGGTINMLLDGTEGQKMMDNITVSHGKVLICEDVGNNAWVGRVLLYDIKRDTLTPIAQHDPNRFVAGAPNFLTIDEESSGVIPADELLGEGWYLIVVQAHYPTDAELVEGGQLLAIHLGERECGRDEERHDRDNRGRD
jgi:hypothetical protein